MLGDHFRQAPTDCGLSAAIGHGHRVKARFSTLVLQTVVRPEKGQDHFCRDPIKVEEKLFKAGNELRFHHSPI